MQKAPISTNEILTLYDLPSPYTPHPCGLLHLPRFIAKIRKHLAGELPKAYQRNFTKGFDGFLCLHLGIEPEQVIQLVKECKDDDKLLDERLMVLFPKDLKVHVWNRKLVQMGISPIGKEKLDSDKAALGISHRDDIISYADLIDIDEGKIE